MCNVFLDEYLNMMSIGDMLNPETPSDNTSGGNSPDPDGNNTGGGGNGGPDGNSSGNPSSDVLTNKLSNQLNHRALGFNRRLSMSSPSWDRASRLDTRELRQELANRVGRSNSLMDRYTIRYKDRTGEPYVSHGSSNREAIIT